MFIDPGHYVSLCGHSYIFLTTVSHALLVKCLPGPPSSFHAVFSLGHIST